MFLPKAASDFQDKMDQFKKAAEGFKGQVRQSCHCKVQNCTIKRAVWFFFWD